MTIRFILGLLFVVSGGEKLIYPYQNFLYVIQSYQLFPEIIEVLIARIFPWIEFLLGVFLVLGLWLPIVLRITLITFAIFIGIISQALLRGLPLTECGCFGSLISLSPKVTLGMDAGWFLLTFFLIGKIKKASILSLDNHFLKQ